LISLSPLVSENFSYYLGV